MIIFRPKTVNTIVFIDPNDAPGILSIINKFPDLESSRAATTLGSIRAGGHDDNSQHKRPQIIHYRFLNRHVVQSRSNKNTVYTCKKAIIGPSRPRFAWPGHTLRGRHKQEAKLSPGLQGNIFFTLRHHSLTTLC